jgi:CheY-like chemotaxis protein
MPQHGGVLIVDDDPDILDTVAPVLEREGYQVRCASDGAQALAALARGPRPDVILLDLMMPVMTGWEVLERAREEVELASIPVVVLSSVRGPPGVLCLPKPVSAEELVTTLDRVCRR